MAKKKDNEDLIDAEEDALSLLGEACDEKRERLPRPRHAALRMMLPFQSAPSDSGRDGLGYVRIFSSQPQCIFKPRGLMIWGAPDDADVQQIWIGKNLQVVAALGPIPAKWFSMAQSYEQVELALAAGTEPPSWPDFEAARAAMNVQVNISSQNKLPPGIKLVMWGLGIL